MISRARVCRLPGVALIGGLLAFCGCGKSNSGGAERLPAISPGAGDSVTAESSALLSEMPRVPKSAQGAGANGAAGAAGVAGAALPGTPAAMPSVAAIDECGQRPAGAAYEVGPDKKYKNIGDVPLEKLAAGDTLRIFWRPEPYREKVLLSSRGEPDKPIRVCGMPGPKGELPIIDGADATTREQSRFPYSPSQNRGLVIITRDDSDRYKFKPGHIILQGLEIRNAAPPATYVSAEGETRKYWNNAASIFVERGEHITIRGCSIHGSGNGIFVASGGDEASLSRDILIEGNMIYGNSLVGREREHNVYTEAGGMVFQFNYFGRPRPGAGGNNIKDRSAGTVFRYNWVQGGAHLLDLVEPEESNRLMKNEPDLDATYVYGNVLLQDGSGGSSLIHYGGDTGLAHIYRNGTLFFYHNTVVIQSDQKRCGACRCSACRIRSKPWQRPTTSSTSAAAPRSCSCGPTAARCSAKTGLPPSGKRAGRNSTGRSKAPTRWWSARTRASWISPAPTSI